MPPNPRTSLGWGDLEVLLAVCRAGSLSGAARDLGCTHSTVYRRLNTIEKRAGVRFFERLPTGYEMTEAGELALEAGERIEDEFFALGRKVLGQDARLRGRVRLTAPQGMMTEVLPPLLAAFRRLHPLVTVELWGGGAAADLGRREADLAVRATRAPPDESLGRKIGPFRFALFATPEFRDANAGKPVQELDLVVLEGAMQIFVPHLFPSLAAVEEHAVFSTTSVGGALRAARTGMGAVFMSCYRGDLEPGLVRLGEPVEPKDRHLWVLTHPALRHTARVKELMRFLVEGLTEQADLFAGRCPRPDPG